LARNDRYLWEFVEALRLCPFAKRCREDGKLHRRVLLAGDDPVSALREVEALPESSLEVALLLFPEAPTGSLEAARAFEELAAGLREKMAKPAVFYCVAFHPDLPRDLGSPHRAVPFIRRSPDPTLQLVRISVLEAIRDGSGERYVDPSSLTLEQLLALKTPQSLSDRIAEANLETLEQTGPDQVEARLTALRP
jgi:hypothetical protein